MIEINTIRVLQVVTIMNRGGLETMLMNYYRKMDRDKIQFDFMVHREEPGDYDKEIEMLGGKIYRMPAIRPGNYRKYFNKLDDFFNEHTQYRTVHAHINENSSFVLKAAKKAGIKNRISHSHLSGLPFDYKYPFRIYARTSLNKNVSHFFACSKDAGKWLFGEVDKGEEITILKNSVDCHELCYKEDIRRRVRERLNLNEKLVIGHIGRFNSQKNHSFLLDVFNEVYKKNKDAVLLLIGDGKLEKEIRKKVNKLNIEGSVQLLGLRKDIPDLLQAMDLFLFPSLYEGLPVALIEAQASGLKCITSTGVTKEANINGYVDFISLNLPAENWANRILDCDKTRKVSTKSFAEKGYDINTNFLWLLNFYKKINHKTTIQEVYNDSNNSFYS